MNHSHRTDPPEKDPFHPVVLPGHALLVVEERLEEQLAQGFRFPPGADLKDLALKLLLVGAAMELRSDPGDQQRDV